MRHENAKFRSLSLTILLIAGTAVSTHAESTLLLPRLQKTAQTTALGQAAAHLEGLNALGVNPAGLHSRHTEFLAQYDQFPLETRLALAGVSRPVKALNSTLGFTFLGLQSTGFERRDDGGRNRGEFNAQEQIFALHGSHALTDSLRLGLSAKMLRLQIDSYQGRGYALDLGARYDSPRRPISVAFSLLNVGQGPAMSGRESKLPLQAVISGTYRRIRPLSLIGTYTRSIHEQKNDLSLGLECSVGQVLSVRGRYLLNPGGSKQGTLFESLTYGFGVKILRRYSFDYAFHALDNSLRSAGIQGMHQVTMTFRFGNVSQTGKGEMR